MYSTKVFSLFLVMALFDCSSRAVRFQDTHIYKQFEDLQQTLSHSESLSSSDNIFSLVGYPVKVIEEKGRKYTIFSLGKPLYIPGRRIKTGCTRTKKSAVGPTTQVPAAISIIPDNFYFVLAAEMPILAYQVNRLEKKPYLYGFQAKKIAYKIKISKNAVFDPHQSFFEYQNFPENDSFLVFSPVPPLSQIGRDSQVQAAVDEGNEGKFFTDSPHGASPSGSPLIITLAGSAASEHSCIMVKSEGIRLSEWVRTWIRSDSPAESYEKGSYTSSKNRPVVIVSIGTPSTALSAFAETPPRATSNLNILSSYPDGWFAAVRYAETRCIPTAHMTMGKDAPRTMTKSTDEASSSASPAPSSSPNALPEDFSFFDTLPQNAVSSPSFLFSLYNFHLPSVPNSIKLSVSPVFIAEDRYELRSSCSKVPGDLAAHINYKKTRDFYSKLAEIPPLKESFMTKSDIQVIREWLKDKK